jgi:signal transduction histidine kinase/ActR/RegA family two-component response regulator
VALPDIAPDTAWLVALGLLLLLVLVVAAALSGRRRMRAVMASNEALAAAAQAARTREGAARNAERAKDDFIAMLGHELRNPLAALAAATEVLKRMPGSSAAAQSSDVIARQVEQMTRLVEDLLDLTRVTRGKVSLTREPLDLAALVAQTVEEMRSAGRLERHELALELSPVWARADRARVAQVVTNLVGNAVKYTPPGGRIGILLRRDADAAVLRVRDSGVGMTPELAARAFDLFVQAEDSGERGAGGLGIGLALVKHLVELQGGKAFAASTGPGEGSVFTITLPAIEAAHETRAEVSGGARHARSIVLIENNDDARSSLAAALQLDGHSVHQAADGNAGVETVSSVHPDVAVVELRLPGIDGFEVARSVRRNAQHADTVLIALTGYGQPDSLRRARDAGFDEYVTKPIAPEKLARLMDVAIAKRRLEARRAQ